MPHPDAGPDAHATLDRLIAEASVLAAYLKLVYPDYEDAHDLVSSVLYGLRRLRTLLGELGVDASSLEASGIAAMGVVSRAIVRPTRENVSAAVDELERAYGLNRTQAALCLLAHAEAEL